MLLLVLFAVLADCRRNKKRGYKKYNYKPKNQFNNYHSSKQPDEFYSSSDTGSLGIIGLIAGLIITMIEKCTGRSSSKYKKAMTDVEQYNDLIDALIKLCKEYNHELNRTRKEYLKAKFLFKHPKRIPKHINFKFDTVNYVKTDHPIPDHLYNERVNNYSHIVRHYNQLHAIRMYNLSL